jgi:hypothetical protein
MRFIKLSAIVLILSTFASAAATTGKGADPISSTWFRPKKAFPLLYTFIIPANNDTACKNVWSDWIFQASEPPPTGGAAYRTLLGVGQ